MSDVDLPVRCSNWTGLAARPSTAQQAGRLIGGNADSLVVVVNSSFTATTMSSVSVSGHRYPAASVTFGPA